jgi:hypothetical protein
MIDWPQPSKGDVQEFFCTGGVWQTWTKPKGVDMVMIFCVGSGASGGGGLTGAAGSARGGGGGGGGGGAARLLVPAILIPDALYIQVGVGGASVGAGTLGNPGKSSFVAFAPLSAFNAVNQLLDSDNAAALGGAAGTSAGSNAGGAGATVALQGGAVLLVLGLFQAIAGGAGSASGAIAGANGAVGVQIQWQTTTNSLSLGGVGGGTVGTNNTDFAGGQFLSNGTPIIFPTIAGGLAGGGAGQPGQLFPKPFRVCGGTGGGTFGTGVVVGGRGGEGAIGCGGGGGGGGVTGGAGGRGGDGYVLIVSW